MGVRYANFDDLKEVAKIKVEMWKSAYKGIIEDEYLNSLNYEKEQKKYEAKFKKESWCIYESNNKILGFCYFIEIEDNNDFDCELIAIYVKPNYTGQGIGKKMFQFVTNEFKNKDKNKMILWVLKDNISSIEFYKKMGGTLISGKKEQIGSKDYSFLSFGYDL